MNNNASPLLSRIGRINSSKQAAQLRAASGAQDLPRQFTFSCRDDRGLYCKTRPFSYRNHEIELSQEFGQFTVTDGGYGLYIQMRIDGVVVAPDHPLVGIDQRDWEVLQRILRKEVMKRLGRLRSRPARAAIAYALDALITAKEQLASLEDYPRADSNGLDRATTAESGAGATAAS